MKNIIKRLTEKNKEKEELYLVDVYKINSEFYKQLKEYSELYPMGRKRECLLRQDVEMLKNLEVMSKTRLMKLAVYYKKGIFREAITDIPITGIKEYVGINPSDGKLMLLPVLYGEEEPLFFTFMDSKEIFDYRLENFRDRVLRPMTDVEKACYFHDNDNKELVKNEIMRQKISAKRDYYSAILDSIDIAENTEDVFYQKRQRIKKIDTKTQQM